MQDPIEIVTVADPIARDRLRKLALQGFGDMVKAVVDLGKRRMAVGGELHADEESVLLDDGSRQSDLWGINIYPAEASADSIEFDSMINVRPSQNNRSRSVDDLAVRAAIVEVVNTLVTGS